MKPTSSISILLGLSLVFASLSCRSLSANELAASSESLVEVSVDSLGSKVPSFELDIQPILTVSGCNAGACHGKQRGQNGFQLSLLGFDNDFDFASLTSDARGRRLSVAAPDRSLLLQKATGEVPHGGGQKILRDSMDYETLKTWIASGAPRHIEGEFTLDHISQDVATLSLAPSQQHSLRVTAHYADGSQRDVTRLAAYLSNEQGVVKVSNQGIVSAGELPGETSIITRYMNQLAVVHVSIPRTTVVPSEAYARLPRHNFIDQWIYEKLQSVAIEPSDVVGDDVFLRRVYTDLIGRLPSVQEARDFITSTEANKREQLIDNLLARPEYADHWATYWADLLRPNPYRVGIKAVINYDNWIRQQFRDNVPYDRFVRELVTAKGSTWRNGATTLYRDRRSPDEIATISSQLFLGIRLECAKCHHHPFERWSQTNFYEYAAFFSKVGHKGTALSPPISGGEEIVITNPGGSVQHPVTGQTLKPTPLFGELPSIDEASDPRHALADWMTSKENDYFAKVQVNRIWSAMMGRGLVEPIDDMRLTNPPTHPELLDALAKEFQTSGFDQKHLMKTIALSRVYSHQSTPTSSGTSDMLNYSRHYRHRFRAEVLLDALRDVTKQPISFDGMPPESRANQIWTTRVSSIFLDTFGRPNENQDPPCERSTGGTVAQTLHLMNSPQVESLIRSDNSRAHQLADSSQTDSQIVEELYLACFSRFPSNEEQAYAVGLMTKAPNRRQVIEDLFWALINAPEFSLQN